MIKTREELDEGLCEFCPYTNYGEYKANTSPYTLCEGAYCEDAYENYLDNYHDEQQTEIRIHNAYSK